MIREMGDIFRAKGEIIFYAEHRDYYPYLEGLIGELGNVCYITSDPGDPILSTPGALYLNRLLPLFMALAGCKVFVMTMPDLDLFHIRRSIRGVHYVYVFHSPVSTHMVYRFGAFDHYDSILCVGPHQLKEIRRHEELYGTKRKKLVETGYCRLEKLYEAYRKYDRKDREITVLVAPTWESTNLLEICGEELLEMLSGEGYRVILRLHPETVKKRRYSPQDGVILETSVANMDSLVEADILITDWSGIGLEYAFGTERPVVFIDTPPKVRNPKYRELDIEPIESYLRDKIGVVVSPGELGRIPSVIQGLMADRELYRSTIPRLRSGYIFNFGRSSGVGADYIGGLL